MKVPANASRRVHHPSADLVNGRSKYEQPNPRHPVAAAPSTTADPQVITKGRNRGWPLLSAIEIRHISDRYFLDSLFLFLSPFSLSLAFALRYDFSFSLFEMFQLQSDEASSFVELVASMYFRYQHELLTRS